WMGENWHKEGEVWVEMESKSEGEVVNLGVVKMKEEEDLVDLGLVKYVEMVFRVDVLDKRV
ncbi:hypothetical protein, partial [Micrococcus luteus]|uniref:hypothetical protein n=1 Tax=Micrococcus luteus TaxID=1270 RepID=UPI001C92E301